MKQSARSPAILLMGILFMLAALGCSMTNAGFDLPEPRPGVVTDLEAFQEFVGQAPTPEQFREVYPEVVLILPGDIATREYRVDNSRYFAELDDDGNITGGSFQ